MTGRLHISAQVRAVLAPFLRKAKSGPDRSLALEAQKIEERIAKKRKPVSSYRVAKKAKALSKKGARADVRAACAARANGICECGCGYQVVLIDLEMDHFLGRARAESVETCWMLSRWCHRDKTENAPSREHWDARFKAFCEKYRYPFRSRLTKSARPPAEEPVSPPSGLTQESRAGGTAAAAGPLKERSDP